MKFIIIVAVVISAHCILHTEGIILYAMSMWYYTTQLFDTLIALHWHWSYCCGTGSQHTQDRARGNHTGIHCHWIHDSM